MKKISITKALAELKMVSKRITDGTAKIVPVTTYIGKKAPIGYSSLDEFNRKASADIQSVNDLIKYHSQLKSKIVRSNAIEKVIIGNNQMTIAEAIEKKSSIAFKQSLLNKLSEGFGKATNYTENENFRVNQRLQQLLEANFGKDSKAKSDEHDAIAKPFMDANEVKIADPLNIKTTIEKLQNEIDEFILNVDVALSEVNSQTYIEIEE